MVRFIAVIIVAVLLGFVVETYSDFDIGVTDSLSWLAQNGFAGGYAIATNVTSVVIGTMFGN